MNVYKQMANWQKRILKDIQDLKDNKFEIVSDDDSEEINLESFRVVLHGPKETAYEGGIWHVRFTIANTYPFASPSVGFVQHILHPNVDWISGSICLDALNKKWSPIFTLRHIMETLLPYLLAYPNPEDPLNREAAVLLKNDPKLYVSRVMETVKRHSLSS